MFLFLCRKTSLDFFHVGYNETNSHIDKKQPFAITVTGCPSISHMYSDVSANDGISRHTVVAGRQKVSSKLMIFFITRLLF